MPKSYWSSHELFWHMVPAVLLSLLTGGLQAAALTSPHATPAGMTATLFDEALLEVRLNGVRQPQPALFLVGGSGALYVSADDLKRWRLPIPGQQAFRHRGVDYYPAAAIPGVRSRVDTQTQQAFIDLPGSAFPETRLDAGRERAIPPRPAMPGGFMNYDVSLQHVQGETRADAQIQLGYFNALGVGSMGLLGRDLGRESDVIRLETSWLVDDPASLTGLRLGDAISRAGAWGGRYASAASSGARALPPSPASSPFLPRRWRGWRSCLPLWMSTSTTCVPITATPLPARSRSTICR